MEVGLILGLGDGLGRGLERVGLGCGVVECVEVTCKRSVYV